MRNSSRDLESDLKTPSIQLVVVEDPGFSTPRIHIHVYTSYQQPAHPLIHGHTLFKSAHTNIRKHTAEIEFPDCDLSADAREY